MSPAPQLALPAGQQGAVPAQWMPQGAAAGAPPWQLNAQETAGSASAAHSGAGLQHQQQQAAAFAGQADAASVLQAIMAASSKKEIEQTLVRAMPDHYDD